MTEYETTAKIIQDADIFVVIGTSLTVSPASDLIRYPHKSVPKFIIDPHKPDNSYNDDYLDLFEHIKNPAVAGMEAFIDRLLELQY